MNFMNANDLGEKTLSKIAEAGITSQVDEVENLDVAIKADPIQLIQGEVDSVEITAKGMVIKEDLRVEEMTLQTDPISVNPLSAIFGQIELTRPTQGTAQVVLTQEDLNRAFSSDYLQKKMQGLTVSVDGKPVTMSFQNVKCSLPGDGKIALDATIFLNQTDEIKQFACSVEPKVDLEKQQLILENIEYKQEQAFSCDLTSALVSQMSKLLDIKNFELEGMKLSLNELSVNAGSLNLLASVYVEKLPST